LTHGKMADERGKKQKVLCTYDQDNKQCKTLILTLLSKDNPQQQLRKFTAVLNGDATAPYSNLFGENNNNCQKNGQRLYCTINIKNRLNKQELTTNK
ncbi:MAG TPA: COP23 domain-containing protein, partial [Allocoleopsis sp.]